MCDKRARPRLPFEFEREIRTVMPASVRLEAGDLGVVRLVAQLAYLRLGALAVRRRSERLAQLAPGATLTAGEAVMTQSFCLNVATAAAAVAPDPPAPTPQPSPSPTGPPGHPTTRPGFAPTPMPSRTPTLRPSPRAAKGRR